MIEVFAAILLLVLTVTIPVWLIEAAPTLGDSPPDRRQVFSRSWAVFLETKTVLEFGSKHRPTLGFHLAHRVDVGTYRRLDPSILQWLAQNVDNHDWGYIPEQFDRPGPPGHIWFRHVEDAFAFKIRWY